MATKPVRSIGDVPGLPTVLSSLTRRNSIVALGDSIFYSNGGTWSFPNLLASRKNITVINKGITGNHLHEMRDRLAADVIALAPRYCLLMGGTNDISAGETLANLASYATSISTQLEAAGIAPIWCSVLPTSYPANAGTIASFNAWLARHSASNGYTFIDTWSAFGDSAGTPTAGLLADGLHPSATGKLLLADTVAAGLSFIATSEPGWSTAGTLLFANPTFATDSNADGFANNLTAQLLNGATASYSLSNHPTAGKWQTISKTGGGAANSLVRVYTDDFGASLTAGDTLDVAVDAMTGASLGSCDWTVYVNFMDASYNLLSQHNIAERNTCPVTNRIRFSLAATVPANIGRAKVYCDITGATNAAVSIGRLSIRKRAV